MPSGWVFPPLSWPVGLPLMAGGSGPPSGAAGNTFILAGTPYKGNVTRRVTDFLLDREELTEGRKRPVPENETQWLCVG